MPNEKKVSAITSRDEDFARWYTDIVTKAELADYSSVRGCMVYRPLGYAVWEMIQDAFNRMIKATGHQNVYMPMFIPESLLQKEKDHVEGFAPEVAWVTHGGHEELPERLCIRPTSETLFCEHYAKIIQSHRDLPKLYNQWCSICRWEKTTRPFLRNTEFLWQEGHTAHATAEEAQTETLRILDFYESICRDYLAVPVIKGQKTEREKFAGAMATYTIESLMYDGKSLQSGTSHNFSNKFAQAFGIQYTDKNNELQYVHQTSWGISTRLIGGLIMVHGDDNGLVLPPKIAPVQLVIIPIASHKEGVTERCSQLLAELSQTIRTELDASDKSPGWKFAEHEMKGVPLRLELGPKDIESGQATLVRRDTSEKR
ncbi:MAG: proline--tRNA ligase, partial [Defluviitaleaceae bacterium]|nr:proline--tRNA ligase [Defluviitaleaceae bacterium]